MDEKKPTPAAKPRAPRKPTPPFGAALDRRDNALTVPLTRSADVITVGCDVSDSRIEAEMFGWKDGEVFSLGALTRSPPTGEHQRGSPPPARGSRSAAFTASSYDAEARTVEAVFSSGAEVRRYFGSEVLSIGAEAIDLTRVTANLCPFLNAHNQWDIGAVLGRVVSARIENGQLVGTLAFADTEAGRAAEGMVSRGELTGISIGYAVRTWTLTESDDDRDTWTASRWELLEVSLVPVPADPSAGVRSAASIHTPAGDPATNEENDMNRSLPGGGVAHPNANRGAAPAAPGAATTPAVVDQAVESRAEPIVITPPAQTVADQVRTVGVAAIRTAVSNAGLADTVSFELLERHEQSPLTHDALMADIGRRFAERDSGAQTVNRVSATVSTGVTLGRAMSDAVYHRMAGGEISPDARQFRGMGMLRMAEEMLSSSGIATRGMVPNEIAERALHTTSDFPALMSNAMNRRLRAAYAEHQPTYRLWARRAPNAPNFKSIDVVQMSAMPDLMKVNEAGEFRYGTASDGKVSYALLTYGRIIALSRQLIINDDLNALDRAMTGFAAAANRLENRTVYSQLTGTSLFPDGKPLFDASHGNLSPAAAAISPTSLGAGRSRMRKQKGLQDEELNIAPAFLIVPTDLEQVAYQYTSSQFVPSKSTDTNEFRAGGRTALEPIVEPILDRTSTKDWYLAANNSDVDTVEYAYLEGAEGVQLSSRMGFTVDGVELKASLDFAASGIDWRGLDKTIGA